MPDTQIFKATYSGIPVYEMMCKGVAVMRRRSDSWLNATQILKVAGFDKPQRTRVLEREVQKGEHEKVQGGYGKYQGTWIPLERGLTLAKQYNCEILLRPIIEFQPAAKSPPLAPKHLVTSTASRPSRRGGASASASTFTAEPSHQTHAQGHGGHGQQQPHQQHGYGALSNVNTRSSKKHAVNDLVEESEHDTLSVRGSEDGSMTSSPSEASSSSRTPSPIRSPEPSIYGAGEGGPTNHYPQVSQPSHRGRKNRYRRDVEVVDEGEYGVGDVRTYGDQILEYFISDTNQIPEVLISPPTDFDPNMAIDDDGHTPLHWACAMGRVRIVKLLLSAGADVFKVNKAGQTALMRSVMFANNYDVRKFPELYELLHRSTLNIDNYNRTVFHHVVDVAMSKGKTHAARYYMETILARLADYPKELADVINFQDEDGESALTMAARCRSKRLVKILIDHGADPKLVNNDGKSTEDYILEDERFRASPAPPSSFLARGAGMSFRNAQAANPPPGAPSGYAYAPANGDRPPLHHSAAGQRASTRCVNDVTNMLDSLAAAFDQELRDKERDTTQAHALLGNIQAEILESQRAVGHLKAQAEGLTGMRARLGEMEVELLDKMGRRYRLGWEKWVKDEEAREKVIREAAGGELVVTPATKVFRVEEPMEGEEALGDEDAQMQGVEGVVDGSVAGTSHEKGKGREVEREEDISDLIALHADIPTDPEEIRKQCEALREDILQHRIRRKETFEELVTFQAEAGTGGRMSEYRRLIGAGCGGIPPSEVDHVLGMLLETLESEEPSSSSVAWTGAKPLFSTVPVS